MSNPHFVVNRTNKIKRQKDKNIKDGSQKKANLNSVRGQPIFDANG